jgi:hypothetical protein
MLMRPYVKSEQSRAAIVICVNEGLIVRGLAITIPTKIIFKHISRQSKVIVSHVLSIAMRPVEREDELVNKVMEWLQ